MGTPNWSTVLIHLKTLPRIAYHETYIFPTVEIALAASAFPAASKACRISATTASWGSTAADTSCRCSTGCSTLFVPLQLGCSAEPRVGRWTSAFRWGAWGCCSQPKRSRGPRAGHTRGGKKATGSSRWRQSGWMAREGQACGHVQHAQLPEAQIP